MEKRFRAYITCTRDPLTHTLLTFRPNDPLSHKHTYITKLKESKAGRPIKCVIFVSKLHQVAYERFAFENYPGAGTSGPPLMRRKGEGDEGKVGVRKGSGKGELSSALAV